MVRLKGSLENPSGEFFEFKNERPVRPIRIERTFSITHINIIDKRYRTLCGCHRRVLIIRKEATLLRSAHETANCPVTDS